MINKILIVESLADSPESAKLSGFALDTIPSEVRSLISTHPSLVKHDNDNVYLTPSIATASLELKSELTFQTLMRIFWYFEKDNIVDQVLL